jgi:hypothetical protein
MYHLSLTKHVLWHHALAFVVLFCILGIKIGLVVPDLCK